jgi:hypothetical protein
MSDEAYIGVHSYIDWSHHNKHPLALSQHQGSDVFLDSSMHEPLLAGVNDPFYAVHLGLQETEVE